MRLILFVFIATLLTSLNAKADRFKPSFHIYAVAGQIPGVTVQRKFGHNESIDSTSTPEDVWDGGGIYQFPATAQTTTIVSDDANDTDGGTGCQRVNIFGLDENYNSISETVTLLGTTPVTLANDYLRVNRTICALSGSSEMNAGNIDTSHGENLIARIEPNHGSTQQVIYTVPAGKKWFVDTFLASINRKSTGDCVLEAQVKFFSTNTWVQVLRFSVVATGDSATNQSPSGDRPFLIPAKSDVRLRVIFCSANGNQITGNVAGYLIDDNASIY